MGPGISDYNMRLILLSMIKFSDRHCINKFRNRIWNISALRVLNASERALPEDVNFINILIVTFLYESVLRSFSLITVWLYNFLYEE